MLILKNGPRPAVLDNILYDEEGKKADFRANITIINLEARRQLLHDSILECIDLHAFSACTYICIHIVQYT